MTSLQWTSEKSTDKCPTCGNRTAFIVGSGFMHCDSEDSFAEHLADGVETNIELTAHWCDRCSKVTSVCVNLPEGGR